MYNLTVCTDQSGLNFGLIFLCTTACCMSSNDGWDPTSSSNGNLYSSTGPVERIWYVVFILIKGENCQFRPRKFLHIINAYPITVPSLHVPLNPSLLTASILYPTPSVTQSMAATYTYYMYDVLPLHVYSQPQQLQTSNFMSKSELYIFAP